MLQFAVEYWPQTLSRVEFFPAAAAPAGLPVTAVKTYIFRGDGLLLTNIAGRGWDLPGGHVEPGETPEQAASRELYEEAGMQARHFELIGYLKITNEQENGGNGKYPKVSCILIYKGYDATRDVNHEFQLEASECRFVEMGRLPQVHHDWSEAKAQVIAYAFGYGRAGAR